MVRGRLGRIAAALTAGVVVAGVAVALATPALAALTPNTIRFWGPNVDYSGNAGTAKRTTVMLKVGDVLYIGGNFDTIRPEPTINSTEVSVSQPYLYAVDATTGAYLPQFDPQLDGTVYALAYDQARHALRRRRLHPRRRAGPRRTGRRWTRRPARSRGRSGRSPAPVVGRRRCTSSTSTAACSTSAASSPTSAARAAPAVVLEAGWPGSISTTATRSRRSRATSPAASRCRSSPTARRCSSGATSSRSTRARTASIR